MQDLLKEVLGQPIIVIVILLLGYLVLMPVLGFLAEQWMLLLIIAVIIILAYLAVMTIYKDKDRVGRGRLSNVP